MDATFWHERWDSGRIAFHRAEIKQSLIDWFDRVRPDAGSSVFVPLCGKSLDMTWIRARDHPVVGVELSPVAVRDFFREQGIDAAEQVSSSLAVHEGGGYRIFCGDFFSMTAADLTGVGAVYDRAALVALPPSVRERYVDHLLSIVPAAAPILLFSLEYDPDEMNGPPFSVPVDEIRTRFAGRRVVHVLDEGRDILPEEPGLASRGLTALSEHAILLDSA